MNPLFLCHQNNHMRSVYLFFSVLFFLSCTNEQSDLEEYSHGDRFQVEFVGALKNIMKLGDISANADLNDFKDKHHFYALGPAENLTGEIIILDSKPYVSSVVDSALQIDHSFAHKAAMLVYATVNEWTSFSIPQEVHSYRDFEKYVGETALKHGIDKDEPFPFLIKGVADTIHWHVIDWPEDDTVHTHEKHVNSGLNGTKVRTNVSILGFYSEHHHAIFTHHSTNMHMHFVSEDKSLSGHLDGLVLGNKMTLYLPKLD